MGFSFLVGLTDGPLKEAWQVGVGKGLNVKGKQGSPPVSGVGRFGSGLGFEGKR